MSDRAPTRPAADDPVAVLRTQHDRIRELIEAVHTAEPADRGRAFAPLAQLLTAHEASEETHVYPAVRALADDAPTIVEARTDEERSAKQALTELQSLDPSTEAFVNAFASFSVDVLAHATSEESSVFPLLARVGDQDSRRTMARELATALPG